MTLLTNIVGYWKFDESVGSTTAADATGNGNTLTVTDTLTVSGKINNGLTCGSNTGAHTGSQASGSLDFAGAVSMSCWVNPSGTASYQCLVNRTAGSGARKYSMFLTGGNTSSIFVAIGAFGSDVAISSPWATGAFNHIAVTADGTTITIYLNGSSVATAASSATSATATADTAIGFDPDFANPLTGTIDEVGIWARALSSAEVSQLYAGGSGLQYPFSGGATFNPAWAMGRNRIFDGLAN